MGNTVRHRRQRANRRRQHDRAVIAQRVSTALEGPQAFDYDQLDLLNAATRNYLSKNAGKLVDNVFTKSPLVAAFSRRGGSISGGKVITSDLTFE